MHESQPVKVTLGADLGGILKRALGKGGTCLQCPPSEPEPGPCQVTCQPTACGHGYRLSTLAPQLTSPQICSLEKGKQTHTVSNHFITNKIWSITKHQAAMFHHWREPETTKSNRGPSCCTQKLPPGGAIASRGLTWKQLVFSSPGGTPGGVQRMNSIFLG